MRPQPPSRLSALISHNYPPHRYPLSQSYRPLSSAPAPLITVRDIPAPHLGHIRVLSLNNPKSRNAISRQLLNNLRNEIERVKTQVEGETSGTNVAIGEGTRVVILASEVDEAFCAGADLKERRSMSGDETKTFLSTLRSTLHAIENLPVPTIAAVASLALGGGLELALATDLRVFASTATVGLPETRLGIIPGAGGCWRLQKLIGKAAALQLILTADRISGTRAFELGIAQHSVRTDEHAPSPWDKSPSQLAAEKARERTLEEAIAIAHAMCKGAPGAVQAALRAVREGSEGAEGREYERVVGMGDRDEALRAFGEKGEAVFRGR